MIRSLRTSILLLACCAAPALHAVGIAPPTGPDDLYARGTSALDQHRWQDAITDFDQVVNAKGKRADAALYWKAYALNKLGRVSLVSATCNQFTQRTRVVLGTRIAWLSPALKRMGTVLRRTPKPRNTVKANRITM